MNAISSITFLLSLATAAYFYQTLAKPLSWIFSGVFVAFGFVALAFRRPKSPPIARLKGMSWSREDFCRGWLITGDTGSGKTRSGITQLLYQVFENEPTWGGLCIDDKGVYWETLREMAAHFNRQDDLILLQVKPEGASADWKPSHSFNLTSDRRIPFSTYAKFVVDTATSLGQQGDKAFFKNQAQTHVALGLEALYESGMDVTLENAHTLLLDEMAMTEAMEEISHGRQTERQKIVINHFLNRYRNQPPEQLGGVKETIANYLHSFLTPEIAEVFCPAENTFEFDDIDRGKIICVAMPQKFQAERRYILSSLLDRLHVATPA